eukprot:703314-Hanusia_phi.AAC.1
MMVEVVAGHRGLVRVPQVKEGRAEHCAHPLQVVDLHVLTGLGPEVGASERALEREGVEDIELSPHHHPPCRFLAAQNLEAAVGEGEAVRVLPEQTREDPLAELEVLRALALVVAAVDEHVLLPRVPVQVAVHGNLALLRQVLEQHLGEEDGGMERARGVEPLAVEVLAGEGAAVVAVDDAVRVQHGDDLEDKVVPENLGIERRTWGWGEEETKGKGRRNNLGAGGEE